MYNGTVEVERFCDILYVPFELATRTECNTCDTDLCNNANVMSINIVALGCRTILGDSVCSYRFLLILQLVTLCAIETERYIKKNIYIFLFI